LDLSPLETIEGFQDALVTYATGGGGFGEGELDFKEARQQVLDLAGDTGLVPDFVRRCRDRDAFWQFIKPKFSTYAERREFLWESFRPLLERLEAETKHPAARPVELTLASLSAEAVDALWRKALERRATDPDGAITAARALLESTCKHMLDDLGKPYPHDADLAKLWALCADELNLGPSQHTEPVFKSILGNCQSVVNNLASIRNRIGDAHGPGRRAVKAKPRHAELAVNLAGTMAAFLVATWSERGKGGV
jgi:hypothetical protein